MGGKERGKSGTDIIMGIAKDRKITLKAAAAIFMESIHKQAKKAKKERQFGTMPDSYDPAQDDSHPDKGWPQN